MQPQHSCGTLESRNKIFSCTVQELYIPLYPLDHYPLLYRACVHTKGGEEYDHSKKTKSSAAMSKSKNSD